ncbi:hypothetical protein KGF56_002532 [Candida oxycetoniae]|uniref:DUF7082 domain-containing protein n=1 Tax=Candida oxycetoniae TaxID=497107 RepID=A0AAI9SXA4_9ASCO|nr:uncharacterized protein KGF56_002532 [Candida oxycetoniae]KAI3404698.2 hypothetical protein KGF56_002532 [Candida oxycetoniae]
MSIDATSPFLFQSSCFDMLDPNEFVHSNGNTASAIVAAVGGPNFLMNEQYDSLNMTNADLPKVKEEEEEEAEEAEEKGEKEEMGIKLSYGYIANPGAPSNQDHTFGSNSIYNDSANVNLAYYTTNFNFTNNQYIPNQPSLVDHYGRYPQSQHVNTYKTTHNLNEPNLSYPHQNSTSTSSSIYSFNRQDHSKLTYNSYDTPPKLAYDSYDTPPPHPIQNGISSTESNDSLAFASIDNVHHDNTQNSLSFPNIYSPLSTIMPNGFTTTQIPQSTLFNQQNKNTPYIASTAPSVALDQLSYNNNTSVSPNVNMFATSAPVSYHPPHSSAIKTNYEYSTPTSTANATNVVSATTTATHYYKNGSSSSQLIPSKRYRVVRGVSAGGCTTRPPKESISSDSTYLPVNLELRGASVEDICFPTWTPSEKEDRRRIIRIERIQRGPTLIANFSIVGSAKENPITLPAPPNVDVIEVSCLECDVKMNDDYDSPSSEDEVSSTSSPKIGSKSPHHYTKNDPVSGSYYQYYITSVELVEIVELLIGTEFKDAAEKRRERGRVRSNLVPFWSKKSISSKMSDTSASTTHAHSDNGNSSSSLSTSVPILTSTSLSSNHSHNLTNQDYRSELARRIMGYDIRKPRGFDKEVRILRWDKLVSALKRALQSYYTEIPKADCHLQF